MSVEAVEQTTTPVVADEQQKVDAPVAAAEPVSNDKEESTQPAKVSSDEAQPEPQDESTTEAKEAQVENVGATESKVVEEANKEDGVEAVKVTNGDSKVDEASVEGTVETSTQQENGSKVAASEETSNVQVEESTEESNGVCKRKAENGADATEEEKTPKKTKVVDDGDQAPVEETAA